ncbi:MAG: GNAT family N-acetyltransferase [Acidobacteria bacterium]|nr:GNAT family N-acetyltransferase [Acidobacteriota bacterium]
MEKTPFHAKPERPAPTSAAGVAGAIAADWRRGLPVLASEKFTLRELRPDDAPSMLAYLGTAEVARFISPPPTTVQGFERFITWTHREREAGACACYGVVPAGCDHVVGLFQVRALETGFVTAEWGFVLGSDYWGTGLFLGCARRVLEFAFETIGALRLEARAAVMNGRGNGALRKVGAVQEGVLRRSFKRGGQFLDQVLWSILAEDWHLQRRGRPPVVH